MNKSALGVLLLALAIAVTLGCGQSPAPKPSKPADKTAQIPITPVTVVDGKTGAQPAPAGNDAAAPGNAESAPQPKPEPLPEVVATVGDDKITAKEFERALGYTQKRAMGMAPAPTIEQKRMLLKNMIQQKAMLADAKSQGIVVTDEDVQKELVSASSRTSPEEFQKRLDEQGIKQEELPDLVRDSLIIRKYVEGKALVTDEDLKTEFDKMKGVGGTERKEQTTDVAHILVRVPEGADDAAWNKAKEKVDAARARVAAGEKFADVAKEVSDDPGSKQQGGLIKEVPRNKIPEFEEKMLSTPVGQVSEAFKSKFGWHILTVVAKHEPGEMTFDDIKDNLKTRLTAQKRSQVARQLMQEAEQGAKVEILYPPLAEAPKPAAAAGPASAEPAPPAPEAKSTPESAAPPEPKPANEAATPSETKPASEKEEKK
jgi:parvulin-like peptidyl-prolyl isomerase